MPISIYPPTLSSTQPAFLASTSEYPIYFTLQKITYFNEIGHAQVRIVRQTNNRSIVDTSIFPDGTIYIAPEDIKEEDKIYHVMVNRSDLIEPWEAGALYKVQMRFGVNALYESKEDFADWKKDQIKAEAFSEWSTVMIIKAIDRPECEIMNAKYVRQDVVSAERMESTLTPLFLGSYSIDSINNESLDKYKFELYEGMEVDESLLLESSGWIQYNAVENAAIRHRFSRILDNHGTYTVTLRVMTANGYEEDAEPYSFTSIETYLDDLEGTTFSIDSESFYCQDNGCIQLYLTSDEELSGTFVIVRTSEYSNYKIWEDLQFFTTDIKFFNNTLIHQDFTIESGVKYKYAIQQENSSGLRTTPLYERGNNYHYVDFEYSYLYRDGVQLRLMYNNTMNSFKHSTSSAKQDTLGDKYPHLSRNGYAYYAEFPVNGLISIKMDYDQTFFKLRDDGFYYKDELVIPIDKFEYLEGERVDCDGTIKRDTEHLSVNTNLVPNNIFIERKFREKVEEFLNDFNYKLFKSPTEGDIIVGLMNVSLSPKKEVNRMIVEFSATAYEVAECTVQNMDKYGIIDIGGYESLASDEIRLSFGQITEIYTQDNNNARPINVYNMIKQEEEIRTAEGYRLELKRLRALRIERYPERDLQIELTELQAKKSELENAKEDTSEVDARILALKSLEASFARPLTNIILRINGAKILVTPSRVYTLRQPVTSFEVVYSPYPLIINYVCELTQVEDRGVGVVSAIDSSLIWGQLSGIFTGTDKILKLYNFEYTPNEHPLQVFNSIADKTIVKDPKGNIIADSTNFNVYKTVNLYEIIKEDTQRQIELLYKTSGPFELNEYGELEVDNLYYRFMDISTFDIEAEPGTALYIGQRSNGSDKTQVIIGPTGRYTLRPADGYIKFIALKEPAFALVNYKSLTTQIRYDRGNEGESSGIRVFE